MSSLTLVGAVALDTARRSKTVRLSTVPQGFK